jgi:hypothetical protein
MKENKMSGPCGIYGGQEKWRQRFGTFIPKERNQLKNSEVRWESYITMDPEQTGWDGL